MITLASLRRLRERTIKANATFEGRIKGDPTHDDPNDLASMEHNNKLLTRIDAELARRTNPARDLRRALPKKTLRKMGLLPPVGSYLCGLCGQVHPTAEGFEQVNADAVGVCPVCVRTHNLAVAELQTEIGQGEGKPEGQEENALPDALNTSKGGMGVQAPTCQD